MRKIAIKLSIAIATTTILLSVFLFYQGYTLTNRHMRESVEMNASMALKFDVAIRDYIAKYVRPVMYELMGKDAFIPEVMSTSYVARTIFEDVRKDFPDFIIKFSSDNPRNPANQAGLEELKIIEYFNDNPQVQRWEGEISINDKLYFAKFSAMRMEVACLRCHSDPEKAPASLLKRYGSTAGFHRPLGKVIGMDTIAIPIVKITEQLWPELRQSFFLIALGLLLFFLSIIYLTRFIVTNRLSSITQHLLTAAQQSNYQELTLFEIEGNDEISDLAFSFNILSDKLKSFYSSLETQIKDRTQELADKNEQLQLEIEERNRAEEALRESEGKLRTVLDATPFPIAVVDLQGDNIHFWSRTALTLFGHTAPSASEWHQIAYPDPNYRREVIDRWKPFLETARGSRQSVNTGEYRITCSDGSVRVCELYATFLPDILVVTFNDITERKRAEEALRKSEERHRAVFEAAKDVSFIITDTQDPEPIVLEFSSGAERMFGFNKTEMVGNPISVLHLPNDAAKFPEAYKQMREGKTGFSGETTLVRKSGKKFPALFSTCPLFDRNGNMFAALGVSFDISEKKRLESELLQAQKMESIGNLAGGIAHDFNNILTSIIGFTELSLDEVEKGTHIEDNLQEVFTAGKRAKDLVQQILAFARQSEEELKPIQVDSIATEALKFIRSSIPTTIEIKQTIESDSLIMGNATQVHQILMNLFTNAAHAMEDKGGILEFSLKDVVMDRGVNRKNLDLSPGNYIKIKVSDTGAGIAPEIIGSIFDPYFTTKGPGEGTGMGLAMVHGIIESYGGKISVDSKPGHGALFTIYLPATRKRQEHRPYQAETLPTGTERILFVDDEASIAKMGSQALERLGYTVSIRTSSIEALELFRTKPNDFDLVITDMTMPNMTGTQLAVELMKIRPDIPVILCTGFGKKISDDSIATIGIRAVAYKPIVKADLAKTVRKVLDDQQPKQTTGRILVIDDESEIRKLFIQKMAENGYEIIEACDGKEGLKLYHENRPDLVITDLVMPEKEGIETITELKREFPNVKIIAISGGGRNVPDAYLQIAKNLGAERIFSKPIDWPELIKAVRELLK